jgi:hypothetical protein
VKSRVEKRAQREVHIIICVKKTVQQARFGQENFYARQTGYNALQEKDNFCVK